MPTRSIVRITATAFALVALAGCSSPTSDAPSASSAPASSAPASSAPASPASSAPAGGADLKTADTALGEIIVDAQGRTAYYFTKDTADSGKSVCSGDCLTAWPAITASAATPTGEGITAKLGTITREDDSSVQVTVNGMPVYLFAKDTAAGDVKGQGVGSVWYVIKPDGTMIKDKAAS